jgi:Mor family transcriptional regulator
MPQEHKFNHEEAYKLRQEGWSYFKLAMKYKINISAVYRAIKRIERREVQK